MGKSGGVKLTSIRVAVTLIMKLPAQTNNYYNGHIPGAYNIKKKKKTI